MTRFHELADELHSRGLIGSASRTSIQKETVKPPFSVYSELNLILYTGILALSTGLGLLVYNNISSIGHLSIIICIALMSLFGFYWCFRKAPGYSPAKIQAPNLLNDYLLLLACLTQVTLFGYLQYQYHLFGAGGLEFLLPALVCFWAAYYFDHLGALSVAITSLGAFWGLAVSPLSKSMYESFNTNYEVAAGLFFGGLLALAGFLSVKRKIKTHFAFTYSNFALHVSFFSAISGIWVVDTWILLIPVLASVSFLAHRFALKEKSFYFFLINLIYSYIALCCLYAKLMFLINPSGEAVIYLSFLLLIGSSLGMIATIRFFRKKLSTHDHIQEG
jgi:hypothetical protein